MEKLTCREIAFLKNFRWQLKYKDIKEIEKQIREKREKNKVVKKNSE